MNPDPDERTAMLIARLRRLREEIGPRIETLRAEGFPVDTVLSEADEFVAALEGRGEKPPDVKGFIARLGELVEEVKTTRHLQDQAEAIGAVLALPDALDAMAQQAAKLREHGGRMEVQSATDLEASVTAARERLERGEVPAEELEDLLLTLGAQRAELKRRLQKRTAATMIYWEKQTPEWWSQRTPEELAHIRKLQAEWAVQREEILSELPLADRQELESMTLEEFDGPPRSEI